MPTIFRRQIFNFDVSPDYFHELINNVRSFVFSAIQSAGYTVTTNNTAALITLPSSYRNDYLYIDIFVSELVGIVDCKRYYFYSTSNNQGIAATDLLDFSIGSPGEGRTLEVTVLASEDYIFITFARFENSILQTYEVIHSVRIDYFSNPVHTVTQNVNAGQNVSIPLSSTSGIVPNSYWIASTESLAGRTVVKVTSVSENSITVESLGINLPSGSKLLKFCDVYVGYRLHSPYLTYPLPSGTSYPPQEPFGGVVFSTSRKQLGGIHILTPLTISHTDFPVASPLFLDYGVYQSPCGVLATNKVFFIPYYRQQSVSIPYNTFIPIGLITQGVVSSHTVNSITDTSKSWATNSLAGKFVIATDIHNNTVFRKIVSNTSNTFTVDTNWVLGFQSGVSPYAIYDTVYYVTYPTSIGVYGHVIYAGENYTPTANSYGKVGHFLVKML